MKRLLPVLLIFVLYTGKAFGQSEMKPLALYLAQEKKSRLQKIYYTSCRCSALFAGLAGISGNNKAMEKLMLEKSMTAIEIANVNLRKLRKGTEEEIDQRSLKSVTLMNKEYLKEFYHKSVTVAFMI